MLSRFQIREVTGLLTGHCHLWGCMFELGKVNNPICRRCYQAAEQPCMSFVIVWPWLNYGFAIWAGTSWTQVIVMGSHKVVMCFVVGTEENGSMKDQLIVAVQGSLWYLSHLHTRTHTSTRACTHTHTHTQTIRPPTHPYINLFWQVK
jgi:hypothetical protein